MLFKKKEKKKRPKAKKANTRFQRYLYALTTASAAHIEFSKTLPGPGFLFWFSTGYVTSMVLANFPDVDKHIVNWEQWYFTGRETTGMNLLEVTEFAGLVLDCQETGAEISRESVRLYLEALPPEFIPDRQQILVKHPHSSVGQCEFCQSGQVPLDVFGFQFLTEKTTEEVKHIISGYTLPSSGLPPSNSEWPYPEDFGEEGPLDNI